MTFGTFTAQHADMASVAQGIMAHVETLTAGQPYDGHDPLPALRLALSKGVANHCSAEIDVLRRQLERHPDIAISKAAMVRRYNDELLAWRGSLMECNANWPARRVTEDPAAFLDAFRPIVAALTARIRWEEQEFYPQVLGRVVRPA